MTPWRRTIRQTRAPMASCGSRTGARASEIDADHEAFWRTSKTCGRDETLLLEARAQGGDLGAGLRVFARAQRGRARRVQRHNRERCRQTVAVEEGQALTRVAEKLVEDLVGGHGCCHGEVSST